MTNIVFLTGTDIDINVPLVGFPVGDIVDMSFTLKKSGLTDIIFTKIGGQITIVGTDITIKIPDNIMTYPGVYMIRMTFTDNLGNIRGLLLDTDRVTFK